MGCEGGCLASKVAKFEDFRRLVVVVLQRSRCVGGFFGKNGFRRSVVGEFSGFLLVSSPGGAHKGEGGLGIVVEAAGSFSHRSGLLFSSSVGFLLFSSFPWQSLSLGLQEGRGAGVADLATMRCRLWVGWWLKKGGRTAMVRKLL